MALADIAESGQRHILEDSAKMTEPRPLFICTVCDTSRTRANSGLSSCLLILLGKRSKCPSNIMQFIVELISSSENGIMNYIHYKYNPNY